MQSTLNTELLASMLKTKRSSLGLRAAAEEIGNVSAATLSRVEQGKIPDVDTFIRICKWLKVPTDTFIISDSNPTNFTLKEQVLTHLRADKELSKETADMLIHMIHLAYNNK